MQCAEIALGKLISIATRSDKTSETSLFEFAKRKNKKKMSEYAITDKTSPLLLNIEAATGVCSVCISRGMELLSKHDSTAQNDHSRVITLLIQQCVVDAGIELGDIDAVALSGGPGSYTSLRVGFSTAKGICYALDKPLMIVPTLAALARAAFEEIRDTEALYCGMIDARRMEVYMGLYTAAGTAVVVPQPLVVDAQAFDGEFSAGRRIFFCGTGAEKCRTFISHPLASYSGIKNCDSAQIFPLAINEFLNNNFTDTNCAVPIYLKPPNITVSRQKPR
jgi:tRNA threonylcarbamoyladenosine biosynthesis protein TsaB